MRSTPRRWQHGGLSGNVERLDAKGFGHACAVLESGGLRCGGYNQFGQLGYPSLFPQPVGDTETPDAVGDVEVF